MSVPVWLVSASPDAIRVRCRVQPRASKTALAGVIGDALKIQLTAPPVDGKANQALEDFLAGLFRVGRAGVTVVSGQTGRNKIVEIAGVTPERVAGIVANLNL